MIKLTSLIAGSLFLASGVASAAPAPLSVNGDIISTWAQEQMMKKLESEGVPESESLNAARARLIERKIVQQAAEKEKIDKLNRIKEEIADKTHQVYLAELLKRNVLKEPPSEEALRAIYDEQFNEYEPYEVSVSHILVQSPQKARDLIEKLTKGGDFAALAASDSLDKVTGPNGGALPKVNVRNLGIPGLAEVTMSMTPGQVLPIPFKSNYGYHVIKLNKRDVVDFPSFDAKKQEITQAVLRQNIQKYIQSLQETATIKEVSETPALSTKPAKRTPRLQ